MYSVHLGVPCMLHNINNLIERTPDLEFRDSLLIRLLEHGFGPKSVSIVSRSTFFLCLLKYVRVFFSCFDTKTPPNLGPEQGGQKNDMSVRQVRLTHKNFTERYSKSTISVFMNVSYNNHYVYAKHTTC